MEKIILNKKVLLIFVIGILFTSCLKEDKKLPFNSFTPATLQDGWNISTPANENINHEQLEAVYKDFHENKNLWQVRSLLVFRNHNLVAETYTKNPEDITQRAAIWSCTKQITAILAGIAVDKNIIYDINGKLKWYLPKQTSLFADKEIITIENLLKMRSGINFENDGFSGQSNQILREIPENSLDFIFRLASSEQGKKFNYNDGDPHIISAVIQEQTGETMRDWAENVLFSKINFTNYEWLTYKDGITLGAFGILTTPRELAKIGHLVLDKGNYYGTQIVSQKWISKMTTPQANTEETNSEMSFGYYWWIEQNRGIFAMCGHGGQYVFIKPVKQLVVVITAEPNTQGKHQLSMSKALEIFDKIDEIAL